MKYTRRRFLQSSSGAFAAAAFYPLGYQHPLSAPSDTVSVGLIGCRGMGFWILHHALQQRGVVCGGICDVDQTVLHERAADVQDRTGAQPVLYSDYRALLDDAELDAVIIGTPDHWHCLQAVSALETGKHVYIEKPLANSVAEGEAIAKAARRYGKVVQVGQQQRSGEHWRNVVDVVRSGSLGRIRQIKLWANFPYGRGPERRPDAPIPDGVDYEMWLGPASERPFNPARFHGSWRFFWDYGGGLLTDWGTHLLDIPLWAMDVQGPPRSVSSAGGIFSGEDRSIETADTQTVLYEFSDYNMVWEHNGGLNSGPYDRNYGIAFIGNNGTLIVNRAGWEIRAESTDGQPLTEPVSFQEGIDSNHGAHVANFIECVRGGASPACPVEAGDLAAFYGHIGNIAYRSGRRLSWNENGLLDDREDFAPFITPAYREPWKLPSV